MVALSVGSTVFLCVRGGKEFTFTVELTNTEALLSPGNWNRPPDCLEWCVPGGEKLED